MSHENAEKQLPESLVLGGVAYNVKDNPELKAFVDGIVGTVAQREKSKLYSTIDALKKEIQTLQNVKIEPTVKEVPAPVDVNKLKQDIVSELAPLFKSTMSEMLKPVMEQTETQRRDAINDYRNKLLIENQDKCIAELVVGNTKEELDAALKNSIAIRSKYGNKVEESAPASTTAPTTPASASPAAQPSAPAQQAAPTTPAAQQAAPVVPAPGRTTAEPTNDLSSELKGMSMDEFAKRRDEMAKKLSALV